jgi:hypothetical protein
VDVVLVVHHDAMTVLDRIRQFFKLKPDPNKGDRDVYLGAKLLKVVILNGVKLGNLFPASMSKKLFKTSRSL